MEERWTPPPENPRNQAPAQQVDEGDGKQMRTSPPPRGLFSRSPCFSGCFNGAQGVFVGNKGGFSGAQGWQIAGAFWQFRCVPCPRARNTPKPTETLCSLSGREPLPTQINDPAAEPPPGLTSRVQRLPRPLSPTSVRYHARYFVLKRVALS